MDDAKLKAAVDALLAKHPQEAVAVYLNAFNGNERGELAESQDAARRRHALAVGRTEAERGRPRPQRSASQKPAE